MEFTSGGTSRSRTVQNLAGGKPYEFTIRPIYVDGIPGTDVSAMESTRETAPNDPPQNIMLQPLELSLYITWEEPAFTDRGGTILTYDIFYRFAQSDPASTVPFMAMLDIQHSASGQRSGNSSNPVQVMELVEGQQYEVKIRAVTAVGPGPNSTEIVGIPAPPRSYQPLNFLLTQNAIIGVGAALCGALLIAILVLAIGLLVYLIRQRRVKMGKHETLMEEEEFDKRQRRREKRRKVISDPIPGMVEDGETKKKLSLRSKDGKILAAPKVIQKQDMAAKPKPGKKVRKVPRDEILISQHDDEDYDSQYDDPADAIDEDDSIRKQRHTDSPRVRLRGKQEMNLYSEPVKRTKTKRRPPSDDESEDEAKEDLVEEAPPYNDVYEDVEMGGSTGADDEPDEVYATVSVEHKAQKRVKMLERQQKEDLKEERKRKKMEEKMERERQKKEAKDRKAAEKKRKEAEKNKSKLSKEEKKRQSLGLGNIVRLQDVDFKSGDARAQAEFIDSATAALF